MNLHVILRTCSESSVHFKERFIPVVKTELIFQCLKSLIISLRHAVAQGDAVLLSVVDDHSSEACVSGVQELLKTCPLRTEFIRLEQPGNNASMKFCYGLARDSSSDLLYLVEDDYLHTPHCVPEMLEAQRYFTEKLAGRQREPEVAIMPVDNMFHYSDETMFSSPLVMGPRRHWRVNYYSNWTMMLPQRSIARHGDVWNAFSEYALAKPETHEDALLVPLFKNHMHLFTPVPTLALHVAGARYESPFSDWRKIWENVENEWRESATSR